jgi:integral membrane protein
MKKYLTTSLGRLRLICFLEGITLLGLVFITMPLRIFFGWGEFSKVLGPIHGGLFVLFVVSSIQFARQHNWKFMKTTWMVILASFIPFGTFYIDHKLLKPMESAGDAPK